MRKKIFISYRRDDAAAFAALLNSRLVDRFGSDRVFIDVDSIGPGVDFIDSISKAVPAAGILLAVIGRRWNAQRLHDPRDLVRLEMLAAIEQGIRIIPILLEEVEMPRQDDLPPELAPLTRRNAVEISTSRMSLDILRLIDEIERIFEPPAPKAPPLAVPPRPKPPVSLPPKQADAPPAARVQPDSPPAAAKPAAPLRPPARTVPPPSRSWKGCAALLGLAGLAAALVWARPCSRPVPAKPETVQHPPPISGGMAGLSLRTRALSDSFLRSRDLPSLDGGVEVSELFPGGPGEQAGVRKGDIIRKVDGRIVKTSSELADDLRRRAEGDTVSLEVWRKDGFRELTVTITDAFSFYESSCARGEAHGCSALASRYEETATDYPKAITHYRTACEAGSLEACNRLGELYEGGTRAPKDLAKAAGLYLRACDGKLGAACVNLGELFEGGLGRPKDSGRAATLYELGCSLETSWGCYQLGRLSESAAGGEKRAFEDYDRACTAGDPAGCAEQGRLLLDGIGVRQDLKRAMDLFRASCDSENNSGCFYLAYGYDSGRSGKRDPKRAAELYGKACEGGLGAACDGLGILYRNGDGVPENKPRMVTLFQRGCDQLETQSSCRRLAILYLYGEEVTKDLPRALSLLATACDANEAVACRVLGDLYVKGEEVTKDVESGKALLRKACDAKEAQACLLLGALFEKLKDTKQALEDYRKACTGGLADACAKVKSLGG